MPYRICLLIAALAGWVLAPLQAQEAESTTTGMEERTATVLAGGGNSFGWFGANGSFYLSDSRWAVHGGLGYAPSSAAGHPSGVAWAAGVRRYTAGPGSQWFVGLLYGLIATVSEGRPDPPPGEWAYGPALVGGWQHTAGSGFTFLASLGIGYAVTTDDPPVLPAVDIGFGYTW